MNKSVAALLIAFAITGCASPNYSPPIQGETATLKLENFNSSIQFWMFLDSHDCRQRRLLGQPTNADGGMSVKVPTNAPITIRWSHSVQGPLMAKHSWCDTFFTFTPSEQALYTVRTARLIGANEKCAVAIDKTVNGASVPVSGREKPVFRTMAQPLLNEDGPWCAPL